MSRYKSDDIELLLPSFREAVRSVMSDMVALGFQPVLFDGMRTHAEALHNAAKGTGIKDSMHEYGVAADVICDVHGWQCRAKGCKFYTKLGASAEARKLLWGGRFTNVDQPHMQGVSIAQQKLIRALGKDTSTVTARDAEVVKFLRRHV